ELRGQLQQTFLEAFGSIAEVYQALLRRRALTVDSLLVLCEGSAQFRELVIEILHRAFAVLDPRSNLCLRTSGSQPEVNRFPTGPISVSQLNMRLSICGPSLPG